ncbi:MAG: 4a-hydroxytetrahydrobiopterin dehydratase [Methanobacterium sp.]
MFALLAFLWLKRKKLLVKSKGDVELPELLSDEEILNKFKSLNNWKLIQMHHLRGVFKFKDFKEALNFVIKVGNIDDMQQIVR